MSLHEQLRILICNDMCEDNVLSFLNKHGKECELNKNNRKGTLLILALLDSRINVVKKIIDIHKNNYNPHKQYDYENEKANCRPGCANQWNPTSLFYMCKNNEFMIANILIDAFGSECDPGFVNSYQNGFTALMWACFHKKEKFAMKLLNNFGNNCNINQVSRNMHSAMEYAQEGNLQKVIEKINELNGIKKYRHYEKDSMPFEIFCDCIQCELKNMKAEKLLYKYIGVNIAETVIDYL